jgi:hypothetical protein
MKRPPDLDKYVPLASAIADLRELADRLEKTATPGEMAKLRIIASFWQPEADGEASVFDRSASDGI